MRLETLQTFDQSDVWTEGRKVKKTKRQKDERQTTKREFNIVTSGQFPLLRCFVVIWLNLK